MDNTIILVCAADDNYSLPLAATTRSVVTHLKSEQRLSLYIIDGGISQVNKQRIIKNLKSEQVDITWIQGKKASLKNMQISNSITIAAYYRLLIPELLPKNIEKAIYIDSDVIVRNSLQELWHEEIGDKYLLAVQDMGAPYISSPRGLMNYQDLGIPGNYKYFNSGVLVMNLKKWREDNIGKVVIQYLDKYKQYIRWFDQDGLNAILAGKWGELDLRWNQMPYLFRFASWQDTSLTEEEYDNLVNHPFIIHYSTREKPWHDHCNHPQKDLFFEYLDHEIWANWHNEQAAKKVRRQKMQVFYNMYSRFKQVIKSLIKGIINIKP